MSPRKCGNKGSVGGSMKVRISDKLWMEKKDAEHYDVMYVIGSDELVTGCGKSPQEAYLNYSRLFPEARVEDGLRAPSLEAIAEKLSVL